jgi:hypothetical protein
MSWAESVPLFSESREAVRRPGPAHQPYVCGDESKSQDWDGYYAYAKGAVSVEGQSDGALRRLRRLREGAEKDTPVRRFFWPSEDDGRWCFDVARCRVIAWQSYRV